MQAEKSVEIEYGIPRNVDAGTHRVIGLLAVGNNNVETVRGAALEDYDQPLGAQAGFDRAIGCASQK